MNKDKLYKFSITGSDEQLGRFWDAVHKYANCSQSRVSVVESSTSKYVYVRQDNLALFQSFVDASGVNCVGVDNEIGISSTEEFLNFMLKFLHMGNPVGGIKINETYHGAYIASVEYRAIDGEVLNHADFHRPKGVEQTAMREENGRIMLVFKKEPQP
jgi:hypothetical protein